MQKTFWQKLRKVNSIRFYFKMFLFKMQSNITFCQSGDLFDTFNNICHKYNVRKKNHKHIKTSLTFKCLIEHLLADFSYSRPLDTYLWKQMMKMNRNITYKWCNIDKKHRLFTKRKCHKFSWLFTASRCSPRRRSICACRIACKVLVSIGL